MAATSATWQIPGGSVFSLQTSDPTNGIITSHIYDDDMPVIRMNDFLLSRQDGAKFVSAFWGNKPIKLDGLIKSVTASGLDGKIDEFKQQLYPKAQGSLTITRGTGDRLYPAYVKTVTITRDSVDITRAPFNIEFVCEQGFGQEPSYVAQTTFSGVTSSNFTFNVLSSGTAPYTPIINLKSQAASQWGVVAITNQATGDTINVARAFSANELLTINTGLGQVRVQGSGITYSGVLPRFIVQSGTNPINVVSASGTQTFDININYVPKYL